MLTFFAISLTFVSNMRYSVFILYMEVLRMFVTDQGDVSADERALEETRYLESVPGMTESIVEGLKTSSDDCVTLDWEDELK